MRHALAVFGAVVALFAAAAVRAADAYTFDKAHTNILFFITHHGYTKVLGKFHDYDGEIVFDPDNVERSRVRVAIRTASINMFHDKLNEHLRTPDFFWAEKFPTMTFVSTKVEKTGEKTGRIIGDLTLLGVTKPVTLEVTFNKAADHPVYKVWSVGFSARGTLTRSDFGMKYAVPRIGDEVELVIEVEANMKT